MQRPIAEFGSRKLLAVLGAELRVATLEQSGDLVSLTMPVRLESYTWDDQLPPVLQMNLHEGYLLQVLQEQFGLHIGASPIALLSPTYDMLTTSVYAGFQHNPPGIGFMGKKTWLPGKTCNASLPLPWAFSPKVCATSACTLWVNGRRGRRLRGFRSSPKSRWRPPKLGARHCWRVVPSKSHCNEYAHATNCTPRPRS